MSDRAQLAQAAARIRALEEELASLKAEAADGSAGAAALASEQDAHAATKKTLAQIRAELDELRAYLADPPAGSGIELMHYLDPLNGAVTKKRYRAEDGEKFKLLPDALQYQAALTLATELAISLDQAKALVTKRERVRANLALADQA